VKLVLTGAPPRPARGRSPSRRRGTSGWAEEALAGTPSSRRRRAARVSAACWSRRHVRRLRSSPGRRGMRSAADGRNVRACPAAARPPQSLPPAWPRGRSDAAELARRSAAAGGEGPANGRQRGVARTAAGRSMAGHPMSLVRTAAQLRAHGPSAPSACTLRLLVALRQLQIAVSQNPTWRGSPRAVIVAPRLGPCQDPPRGRGSVAPFPGSRRPSFLPPVGTGPTAAGELSGQPHPLLQRRAIAEVWGRAIRLSNSSLPERSYSEKYGFRTPADETTSPI